MMDGQSRHGLQNEYSTRNLRLTSHVSRAPPGARYDPIGPGDGPPNLRGGPRFLGGGGFGGGRPQNPFGGFGGDDFI